MKMNFFKGISALAAVLLTITACDKEKEQQAVLPEVEVKLVSADATNISFSVTASNAESFDGIAPTTLRTGRNRCLPVWCMASVRLRRYPENCSW